MWNMTILFIHLVVDVTGNPMKWSLHRLQMNSIWFHFNVRLLAVVLFIFTSISVQSSIWISRCWEKQAEVKTKKIHVNVMCCALEMVCDDVYVISSITRIWYLPYSVFPTTQLDTFTRPLVSSTQIVVVACRSSLIVIVVIVTVWCRLFYHTYNAILIL